ncbi:hypothetical protein H0H81_000351, partial [Sphagnurus paluster]
ETLLTASHRLQPSGVPRDVRTSGIQDRSIRNALKPSRTEAVGTPASLVKDILAGSQKKQTTQDRNAQIAAVFVNRGPQGSRSQAPPPREAVPDTHPLITKVVGARHDASTGGLLEYHIEVCPVQLVNYTRLGVGNSRKEPIPPPKPPKKPPPAPESVLRLWVPGSVLHQVHPGLVEDYGMREEEKNNKPPPRARGKRKAPEPEEEEEDARPLASSLAPLKQVSSNVAPRVALEPARTASSSVFYPPLERNHAPAMDPWFAVDDQAMRFLFTFRDPDEPDSAEYDQADASLADGMAIDNWAPDIPQDRIVPALEKPAPRRRRATRRADGIDLGNDDSPLSEEDSAPQSTFDILFDQILDGRGKKAKAKAPAKKPRRTKGPAKTSSALPKIRETDSLITKLDKLGARQAEKRQKVAHAGDLGGVDVPAPAPRVSAAEFPLLRELDSRMSTLPGGGSSSARVREKEPSTSARALNPYRTYYPEPSSSQDSRLSLQDNDLIDLT